MKKSSLVLIVSSLLLFNQSNAKTMLDTPKKKQSYALGHNIASNLKNQGVSVNTDSFVEAIKDVFLSQDLKMDDAEMQNSLNELSQRIQAEQSKANQGQSEENEKEGLAYMSKNKEDKDVKETPSGLQYKIISLGKGEKPKVTDKVKVHYAGTFINGDEFDSSYKRGEPATFGLKQVIAGWTEILQLMPVGSKFSVVIPGNLAYGASAPASIGPNRTLLFDIELLGIE